MMLTGPPETQQIFCCVFLFYTEGGGAAMSGACSTTDRHGTIGVMWKTVSEDCNLACDYCYYSTCGGKPGTRIKRIDSKLLETFIKQYMACSQGSASFAWQGGEPLLAGLDFFEEVVRLQAKYAPAHTAIGNSLQTNGTLITAKWAEFFKTYRFLIGVSLDGPQSIHDARRITSSGAGSYERVMQGIRHLREHQVDFNILTVIHEGNVGKARELMDFYREHGFTYVQFIPCMDFRAQETNQPGKFLITPEQYGQFLCEVFDIWYNGGKPVMSERFFDNLLGAYVGREAELCIHRAACPKTIILEQNGDAYPCDFYISDDYKLGNVGRDSLADILESPAYDRFLKMKPSLPDACVTCEYLKLCHGGCPRNRKWSQEGQAPYPDYFCASYKRVYRYAHERMELLAASVRRNWLESYLKAGLPLPGRNDACVCGSGRKFKKCCEGALQR